MTTTARTLLEIAQAYSAPGLHVRARLESISPGYLMHNPDAMNLQAQAAKEWSRGHRSKFIPEPEQEAEWGSYRFEDGTLCIPTRHFLRSFIEAGKAFKIPKSRANFSKAAAAGIRAPEGVTGFALLDSNNKPLRDYTVHIGRVVIARASVMRARPWLEPWACETEFLLDTDAMSPDVFADIIGYAGARVGIGDWRPEKSGQFGCWTVTSLEV
jgi:hypothetical protein